MALAWTFAGSVICFFPVGVAWACKKDALRRSSVDVVAKIGDRVMLGAVFSRMNRLIVATLTKGNGLMGGHLSMRAFVVAVERTCPG